MEIDLDVPVPMRDGTILRADVYRPAGRGPWPVLIQRTPYDKRALGAALPLDTLLAVSQGYIVVQQDTRGRFASDGEWSPWTYEQSDGHDTVKWAATLRGSTGAVGMFGVSYTGNTSWTAAVDGPPELRAIAAQNTWSDPSDGLFMRGGALELGLNAWWSLFTGLGDLPKRLAGAGLVQAVGGLIADYDGLAERTYWELPAGRLPSIDRYGGPDIGTQRALDDPQSASHARIAGRHDAITTPSLNITGWYDAFLQGALDNYVAMAESGCTTKLLAGPWPHVLNPVPAALGEINFGLTASPMLIGGLYSLTQLELRWFDHWLCDNDTGFIEEPPVKIFVMGANTWRDENEWPLARAVDTPWYLGADGALGPTAPATDERPDTYIYDPTDPVPTCGGPLVMAPEFPPGPFDQAAVEQRSDVLLYTSEPLAEDLEVTGRIRATLFAATDAPSTDWVVRLCDVDTQGISRNITDGILRINAESGTVGEYEIDMWSTSNLFRAGHRIRVQVTSSNFPRWDRNPNTGEPVQTATTLRSAQQRIFHDGSRASHIVLPIVPPATRA
ncbi:CocE/NonD family hydrolase [Mycolicibacterium fortuitum]|uniref:CocE/NonD family hydrolase n=1 Tax=Mycolicibacterium fortuitum TaxID=1766 RepID=UPI001F2794C3|nr:CocE/NonD family hydrolase [Mycolicibacterium fortuitum]